ncbi:hypothetical protein CEXT_205911 [Caerostris extrusa]|uniref:Uncharacterized protein n=1 Tax=Caerostris extrusa TaxID=172846 RepID=A0AAV4TT44_CAEEX|nr:hypothetical protein CEXT_205911 [Caerostris extrusa]
MKKSFAVYGKQDKECLFKYSIESRSRPVLNGNLFPSQSPLNSGALKRGACGSSSGISTPGKQNFHSPRKTLSGENFFFFLGHLSVIFHRGFDRNFVGKVGMLKREKFAMKPSVSLIAPVGIDNRFCIPISDDESWMGEGYSAINNKVDRWNSRGECSNKSR